MSVTKFAQNGLVRLSYEADGESGTPVVVVHGLLADRVSVRPLTDALTEHHRVIVPDLRGHGGSSAIHGVHLTIADLANDVLAVLDHEGVTDAAIFVGVDLGAVIAEKIMSLDPGRVRAIVTVNHLSAIVKDGHPLSEIADRAYKGQIESAVNDWLDIAWAEEWRERIPRPRIAAARRYAPALHAILLALVANSGTGTSDFEFPAGLPFGEDDAVNAVVRAIEGVTPDA